LFEILIYFLMFSNNVFSVCLLFMSVTLLILILDQNKVGKLKLSLSVQLELGASWTVDDHPLDDW